MINPVLSNFRLDFSDNFFPVGMTQKYDDFLFHKNYPFKTLKTYFYETIQSIDIPGMDLNVLSVNGMNNTGNLSGVGNDNPITNMPFLGNNPDNEITDNIKVIVSFRNTLLNWMYCFEMLHNYNARKRFVKDFFITLTMKDSAEIPMIQFQFTNCFVATCPGMTFAYNVAFNDSKTFEISFVFTKFQTKFIFPNFNVNKINI